MTLDAALLRQSFELVLERAPDLTARFYDVLFAKYPAVRPLFRNNARAYQEQMLARALAAVLDHLEDASWLDEQLAALGSKHVDYGVRPEMYDWVGDALLTTLADAAGPLWSDALHTQWAAAYGAIVSRMRRGERMRIEEEDAPVASDAAPA